MIALLVIALVLLSITLPEWVEELINKTAGLLEKLINLVKDLINLLTKLVKIADILEGEKGGSGNYSRET